MPRNLTPNSGAIFTTNARCSIYPTMLPGTERPSKARITQVGELTAAHVEQRRPAGDDDGIPVPLQISGRHKRGPPSFSITS